jgi:hypothetical protein
MKADDGGNICENDRDREQGSKIEWNEMKNN